MAITYGLYNDTGAIRRTVVTGATRVGLFASDGSVNVVLDDAGGSGRYHKSGALRVNSGTTTGGIYDTSGAYYSNRIFGNIRG